MPKIFKRKCFSALLITLLMLPSLFSCSGAVRADNENDFSLSSLEVIPTDVAATDNIVYPEKFTVLCESGTEDELFASSDNEDILKKSIFLRNSSIFTDYGITLEYISDRDIVKKATAEMLAEDKGYDMLLLSAPSSASLITNGALADIGSIAGWSESLEGYSHKVMKDLSVGGKIFLAAGDATPSLFTSTSAVLMNYELASDIKAENSIVSVAKSGRFTYDSLLNFGNQLSSGRGEQVFSAPSVIRLKPSDLFDLYLSVGGTFLKTDYVTDIPEAISFGSKETELYKNVMSLFGISEEDDTVYDVLASAPLFTVASISELLSFSKENSPFVPLPMPKSNIIQGEYICNIDIKSVRFTALPYGKGANELAVMSLIYKNSNNVIESICETVDKNGTGTPKLVYESARASLVSLFGFGDIEGFMESCINERLSSKIFAMRAKERSQAASAALSIVIDKSINAN